MHTVVQLPNFGRAAVEAGLSEQEVEVIVSALAANPMLGDVIVGTGGARKVRFPGRGKGKSGGYRSIHFFAADDVPVFLLAVYGKGDKANLSKAERNCLAKVLPMIADAYRASVKAKVQELRAKR